MARFAESTARGGVGLAFVVLLLMVGWSVDANAAPIEIGGVDIQSQYTGFNPLVADSGVFTFYDSVNGTNPSPEPGTVTTESQALGLIDGRIDLQIKLDTTSYNPATDNLINASFVGTGDLAEILIWDSTQTTVLLAFDVDFINVTTFTPQIVIPPFVDIDSIITLGSPLVDQLGLSSSLSVRGGSLADEVGGVGTAAVLQLTISKPNPQVTQSNADGYLNDSFVVGIPGDPPTLGVNWEITIIPEPSTSLLVAGSLLAWAALARRRRHLV